MEDNVIHAIINEEERIISLKINDHSFEIPMGLEKFVEKVQSSKAEPIYGTCKVIMKISLNSVQKDVYRLHIWSIGDVRADMSIFIRNFRTVKVCDRLEWVSFGCAKRIFKYEIIHSERDVSSVITKNRFEISSD
jgi:hypothetical protein